MRGTLPPLEVRGAKELKLRAPSLITREGFDVYLVYLWMV